MTTPTVETARLVLMRELHARRERNHTYSPRSFARHLGLSPATLSQVLSGKRPLTARAAMRIADRCAMAADQRRTFLEAVVHAHSSDPKNVRGKKLGLAEPLPDLELETFRVIADWQHFAILSLASFLRRQNIIFLCRLLGEKGAKPPSPAKSRARDGRHGTAGVYQTRIQRSSLINDKLRAISPLACSPLIRSTKHSGTFSL